MLRSSLLAIIGVATGIGASAQIPPAPLAPVIAYPPMRMLQHWSPGDARCGGVDIPASRFQRPEPTLLWGSQKSIPQTFSFRVDATGRPLSIVKNAIEWVTGIDDLAPSLAASRLDGLGPLSACEITYTAEATSLADAPIADVVSYSIKPMNGALPPEGWARIRPVGGDCDRQPRPQWLTASYPDYARLPGVPGARSWSLVGYDLDAKGRPRHVETVLGTGNGALDRAAVVAMARSRLTNGPRQGCRNPYVRRAERLPAPADVDPETVRPAGATCTHDGDWDRKPVLTYPENFNRRSIEGWALIGFDVAPWGATGNLRVLASEPAQEFGARAMQIVAAATKAKSATGATGCVERVRFVIRDRLAEPETE